LFPDLRARAYLNHAAISPASEPVRLAAKRALDELACNGSAGFSARLQERERLRSKLARLLGADSDEIALVPSTMYGLTAIAISLPWRAGARILGFAGEYPTNVSVWQRACERFGVSLTLLPIADFASPDGPNFAALERELARGDVQLCAVSAVQFQTGLRTPLAQISALCHRHGAELAVDAVQAIGCLPFDVRALGVDYLAAGSHKWLLGIDGAGVLYARRDLAAKLRPGMAGAMSHVSADAIFFSRGELRYDRPLRSDVRVFEGGMLSSVSVCALDASLDILLSLGTEAIFPHVSAYLDALEPALIERGFSSLRLRDSARRSGILGVLPPAAAEAGKLATQLIARGITCSSPDGVLRFAPHFANSLDEIPEILSALDAILRDSL
jgi:selenocysteine lyase/cysteine desulfurase